MKNDIVLAGVGGQGILSIAAVIGIAAVENGLFLKQSEIHGMSQRGGDVQSHLRISDRKIGSDLIPHGKADLIIAVDPMESLRHLPWLAPGGWIITNSVPQININDYPPIDELLNEIRKIRNSIIIDADAIARDAGSVKASNMVVLGSATPFIDIPFISLENAIRDLFGKKGSDVVEVNLKALKAGRAESEKRLSGH